MKHLTITKDIVKDVIIIAATISAMMTLGLLVSREQLSPATQSLLNSIPGLPMQLATAWIALTAFWSAVVLTILRFGYIDEDM